MNGRYFFWYIKLFGIQRLYWVLINPDSSRVGPLERQNSPNKYLTQLYFQARYLTKLIYNIRWNECMEFNSQVEVKDRG